MKSKNRMSEVTLPSIIVILIFVIGFYSCKKYERNTSAEYYIKNAAKALKGETLAGSITVARTDNEVVLDYNNGHKFLFIQKLEKDDLNEINSISLAVVVTSEYGIIIKDVNRNKLLLLPNNDTESIKRFESAKSLFNTDIQSIPIFGTTIVNADRA